MGISYYSKTSLKLRLKQNYEINPLIVTTLCDIIIMTTDSVGFMSLETLNNKVTTIASA